jgi:hypothetical protein
MIDQREKMEQYRDRVPPEEQDSPEHHPPIRTRVVETMVRNRRFTAWFEDMEQFSRLSNMGLIHGTEDQFTPNRDPAFKVDPFVCEVYNHLRSKILLALLADLSRMEINNEGDLFDPEYPNQIVSTRIETIAPLLYQTYLHKVKGEGIAWKADFQRNTPMARDFFLAMMKMIKSHFEEDSEHLDLEVQNTRAWNYKIGYRLPSDDLLGAASEYLWNEPLSLSYGRDLFGDLLHVDPDGVSPPDQDIGFFIDYLVDTQLEKSEPLRHIDRPGSRLWYWHKDRNLKDYFDEANSQIAPLIRYLQVCFQAAIKVSTDGYLFHEDHMEEAREYHT